MILFAAGLAVGAIVQYIYSGQRNTCVCSECRRAQWNAGEDPYGRRGDGDGSSWRP